MNHQCPGKGCTRMVPAHMLACRPHWYQLPADLRSAIWNAWRSGMGAGSPEHNAAIADAMEFYRRAGS